MDLVYGTPSERNEACNTVDEYVDQLENNTHIVHTLAYSYRVRVCQRNVEQSSYYAEREVRLQR